ncbi:esterase-like activity of phytase family protein [Dokdonella sp.]|uniref:choice-of-anchor I domain-containing protein n=1 Tax=Dokdonella sp. TaxID=2291710 RepID=UPI003527725A
MTLHPFRFTALAVSLGCALALPVAAQSLDLIKRGTYSSGVTAGSEIVAFDAGTQRLFVTNGATGAVDVIDASNVDAPALLFSIDISAFGSTVTSVAVKDGLVAVAIPNASSVAPGVIAFFDTDGQFLRVASAGVLPDNVVFSPDGLSVLAANEGEPVGEEGEPDFVDPRGSITLVDLAEGINKAVAYQIGLTDFDGREEELRARGVRIFPGRSASRDLEPEYVAVSPDNSQAFVSLQEANAFAVIDIASRQVLDIVAAGLKNHARGLPRVETYNFPTLPVLGTTAGGQDIRLGGFSALWFEGIDGPTGKLRFATVPDRGPNGEPSNVDGDPALERPFALPDYQPRIARFMFNPANGQIELGSPLMLTRADGTSPMTGLPNIAGVDEEPVDLFGNVLDYDPLGADLEGLVIDGSGNYWMVDEYRPAIYQFSPAGALLARYVPAGTAALGGQPVGTYGLETLPAEYSTRRANRGFEGMALDTDAGILYAFIQTPLANPNRAASDASKVIRMLGIDPTDGQVVAEYVYLIDKVPFREQNTDKIGDAVYAGNGQFYIVERDDSVERSGKKMLFEFNLIGATNLRGPMAPALLPGLTLEQHTPEQLVQAGIHAVAKIKVANLPSIGYFEGDKLEGIAILGNGELALLNDNDFGVAPEQLPNPPNGTVPLDPEPTPIQLGLVRFDIGSGLDASDRDGPAINITNWPVFGMHMPDTVAAFADGNGETFYASAGEGDDRGEDARIGSGGVILDPAVFPNAAALKDNAAIGRLGISTLDGDLDGDGDHDRLQVYGSRSMAVWDKFGNLVYDSGDLIELITAQQYPNDFNSENEENQSLESRSDNKGPEPEALAVGTASDGRTYAFVGLERIGGIVVFDVTDPYAVQMMGYANNRNFAVTIDLDGDPAGAGDLGPEGIRFIPASESPTGDSMIAVANEISGTTTLYSMSAVLFRNGFD